MRYSPNSKSIQIATALYYDKLSKPKLLSFLRTPKSNAQSFPPDKISEYDEKFRSTMSEMEYSNLPIAD